MLRQDEDASQYYLQTSGKVGAYECNGPERLLCIIHGSICAWLAKYSSDVHTAGAEFRCPNFCVRQCLVPLQYLFWEG